MRLSRNRLSQIGTPMRLSRDRLSQIGTPVSVPRYDASSVRAGIVHLGLGAFHRAHMARYTHDLMQQDGASLSWGILGVELMRGGARLIRDLASQDGLYTVVERGAQESVSVVASLAGVRDASDSRAAVLAALDDAAIRIISLTVTENGYCLNPATKRLDLDHVLIRADLEQPKRPRSAIGVIVETLRRRRARGRTPPTVLSCDNIQHNGDVLRDAVATLAAMRDEALARWIADEASFPNTMVDRITPVTYEADVRRLEQRYGIHDDCLVVCESFRQWVVEDRFRQGRPAWERVGAQFVDDVAPYERMKLRLLNASHLAVAGLGQLAGYETIHESMADRRITAVMTAMMDKETGPTLGPVPGIDLGAYKRTLVERFSNAAIRDTVQRVNSDAPVNLLIDPIRDRLAAGAGLDLLALALAAWFYRVRGIDAAGRPVRVVHPLTDLLKRKAAEGGPDPAALLSVQSLFGGLGTDRRLVDPLADWLGRLYRDGIEATLDEAHRRAQAASPTRW
jgi:mannitol 2-dehydrogenase